MPNPSKNITLYRTLLLALVVISSGIILFVFLLNTISPTDENIFAEPPSRFYLTRDIPFSLNGSRKDPSDTSKTDTLKSGFLLMKLNNAIPRDSAQLVEVIKSLPNGLEVPISVFNNITLKFEKGKVLSNYITPDLFKFLHSAILIVDVTPGGASETAGIQVGDYILKVRGSNFRSPTEADSILRATESGRFIPYKVLRDNNEFEVDVKLAKFGINFIVLLAFIAALIYLFLGAFIGLKRPRLTGAKLMAAWMILWGINLSMTIQLSWDTLSWFLILKNFVKVFTAGFGLATLLHCLLYFPKTKSELLKKRWVVFGPYIMAIIISLYYLLAIIFRFSVFPLFDMSFPFLFPLYSIIIYLIYRKKLRTAEKKIGISLFWTYFLMIAVLIFRSFSYLFNFYIEIRPVIDLSTILIFYLPPITFSVLIIKYKIFDLSFRIRRNIQYGIISTSWKVATAFILVLGLWFIARIALNLPEVIVTGKSIEIMDMPPRQPVISQDIIKIQLDRYKKNFQDIALKQIVMIVQDSMLKGLHRDTKELSKFDISDNIKSSALQIDSTNKQFQANSHVPMFPNNLDSLIKASVAGLDTSFTKSLPKYRDDSLAQMNESRVAKLSAHNQKEKFILMILALIWAVGFWKASNRVQDYLDKKFYRTHFDYRQATNEFSKILAKNLSLDDLAFTIIGSIRKLVHLKNAGIVFFKNGATLHGREYLGYECDRNMDACQEISSELMEAIKPYSKEISTEYLPENLKNTLINSNFQFIIPIRQKEKIVGAMLVGEKLSEVQFQKEDFEFLSAIGNQIAVAIENSFLYEELAGQERLKHELEIARRIQLASLPQNVPNIAGLDISGYSLPAHEVGGDFYDFLNGVAGELTVVVGDVSGKGTSAALYMSQIQGIMRTLNDFITSPRDLMIRTNQNLYTYMGKGSFITAIGARINVNKRIIRIARAGHLPVFHYKCIPKAIDIITPRGLGLGITPDLAFTKNIEEIERSFTPGDIFLFVTDGITEARDDKNQDFGFERLVEIFNNSIELDSEMIRENIVSAVKDFTSNVEQYDDLTVVVVKVK